ncbi:NAD(P)-dependent oxidoreductase [Rhodopseudomonas parapalustris]
MALDPILLIGGSGIVGRWTARLLRAAHPSAPLLIGGRDAAAAQAVAKDIGGAEGVGVDTGADDLGLGGRPVGAVAALFSDQRLAALRFAQARGVPHISISPGLAELGPEVAAYIHRPRAAPIVLGTEWLVGAASVPTLAFARTFSRLDTIVVDALLDEEDAFGPAALADLERQTRTMPMALMRRDGAYVWCVGDDIRTHFRAIDGTEVEASVFALNDVVGLAAATGAPNVQFNLALGVSSTRRRGEPMSTEIIIELRGGDHAGRPLRTRHAIVHGEGQMPLTGLGVAMVLERLVGLDGAPAVPAGLYFPHQLLDAAVYLPRLEQAGGRVLELE